MCKQATHGEKLTNQGSDVLLGDVGVSRPQYVWNCKRAGQKVDQAARELATVLSVTFVLEKVAGHMIKTPPHPNRKCLNIYIYGSGVKYFYNKVKSLTIR